MRILTLLFCLINFSCATTEPKSSLYSTYKEYVQKLDRESIKDDYRLFFSPNLLSSEKIDDPEVVDQLLFKSLMVKHHSNYEKLYEKYGCLTVNGFDEENEPMAFNLKYIPNHNNWLISEIHILYADSESKFSLVGTCPHQYEH